MAGFGEEERWEQSEEQGKQERASYLLHYQQRGTRRACFGGRMPDWDGRTRRGEEQQHTQGHRV